MTNIASDYDELFRKCQTKEYLRIHAGIDKVERSLCDAITDHEEMITDMLSSEFIFGTPDKAPKQVMKEEAVYYDELFKYFQELAKAKRESSMSNNPKEVGDLEKLARKCELGKECVLEKLKHSEAQRKDKEIKEEQVLAKQLAKLNEFFPSIQFFDELIMPQNPVVTRAIVVLMPLLRSFVRHVGFARLVLAAKIEAFLPSDDQILECSQLHQFVVQNLEAMEAWANGQVRKLRGYLFERPARTLQTLPLYGNAIVQDSMKLRDHNVVSDTANVLASAVQFYASMTDMINDVNIFIQGRGLLSRNNFYN